MKPEWSPQQRQVIDLRNRNLLVSAAAGSGKTAVLVERIIQKIMDENHPTDIDRLLIVTFTNAAASEMRERIGTAIEQALEKQPENVRLQRQQTLLHNAQITTIHSFCLYVIRNYFHRIELDPEFRVAEEGELKLLKSDVLDRVLEQYYQEAKPEFLTLSETIATGKTDEPLKETILKLFDFAMSYPWVEEWLENCKKPFQVKTPEEFERLPLAEELLSYLRSITGQWALQMKICRELSLEEDGPQMYAELLSRETEAMERIESSSTYQQYYERIRGFSFGRLAAARKYSGDPRKKEQVQKLRNEVKSSVKKVTEQFFFQNPEEMIADLGKNRPTVDMLIEVTLAFLHGFAEKKREKNLLDFNDLEHFALKILVDETTHEPSRTAAELRKNYEEIMIDEYQDSNYVQETILKAVSREAEHSNNIFMVGDVKQSIYRFRMARPELFMEKYNSYTQEDSPNQRIDLYMNFRSRPQVIQTVNDIFYRIMKEDIGNITYSKQAALYPGASFPEGEEGIFDTRFLVVEPEEDRKEQSVQELEARAVGMEIQRLMKEQQVTSQMKGAEQPGSFRPVRYSDMVILLRSMTGWADTFGKVLGEMGIPVRAASGTGYFSAVEVQTALNLLRILDNPRQDIPMASVLASPIVGLTGEDLALIRTAFPGEKFYQAVMHFSEKNGERDETQTPADAGTGPEGREHTGKGCMLSRTQQKKLTAFLELLDKFRRKVSYTPIHELLYQVLEETGYQAYVYALPGGQVKQANLEMLVEKAIAYETTSYRGLFHFIRYMEQLQKYEMDFPMAEGEEAEDAVRIMSIHKSKGLEFPVVFVSGLGKMFNSQDVRERVVLHPRLGIGMDVVDCKRRLRTPGLTRQFLARKITMENVGEELRVLYVALTRAREKLILTGVLKKAEEKIAAVSPVTSEDGFLTFLSRLNSNTFLQFLLLAGACSPQSCPVAIIKQAELEAGEVQQAAEDGLTGIELLAGLEEADTEWQEKVAQRLTCTYPFEEEVTMKTKVSVSELKHRILDRILAEEEGEPEIPAATDEKRAGNFQEETESEEETPPETSPEKERCVPAFMEGVQEENTGARRGTAMHRVLECYDFTENPESLEEQLQRMEEEQKISRELLDLISVPSLKKFLRTGLGVRMKQAAEQKKLCREKPFVMGKKACEVLKESSSGEMILIQGIIDVFFEEEDGIVLLDYKTDHVKNGQQLADRYRLQLDLYQEAIERAVGKKVKEKLLYSFCLEETVPV